MNIFVVNQDPELAAKDLADKHIIKMIVESLQLLCTVANKRGFEAVYKPTHQNHPATLWLEKSSANWNWLCLHGLSLCKEYTFRYGKTHKCESIIGNMLTRTIEIWGDNKPYEQHTPFAQCMPEHYRQDNAVEAYRAYYRGDKQHIASWTKRVKDGNKVIKINSKIPEWFI